VKPWAPSGGRWDKGGNGEGPWAVAACWHACTASCAESGSRRGDRGSGTSHRFCRGFKVWGWPYRPPEAASGSGPPAHTASGAPDRVDRQPGASGAAVKEGPAFDLPDRARLLLASCQLAPERLDGVWSAGELALTAASAGARGGFALRWRTAQRAPGPVGAAAEWSESAAGSRVLKVWRPERLVRLEALLRNRAQASVARRRSHKGSARLSSPMSGARTARRSALEIAAAGNHTCCWWAAGSGKTMLARLSCAAATLLARGSLEACPGVFGGGLPRPNTALVAQRRSARPPQAAREAALIGAVFPPARVELYWRTNGVLSSMHSRNLPGGA